MTGATKKLSVWLSPRWITVISSGGSVESSLCSWILFWLNICVISCLHKFFAFLNMHVQVVRHFVLVSLDCINQECHLLLN